MRFFYLFLLTTLQYAMRVYFKSIRTINSPKEFFGRTIYVSNHAAAFMDPLVITGFRRPIVFFMTRADVFNRFTKPFLWAGHMLPIYRQHDGTNTKSKNDEVFDECAQILKNGRNLLIFAEGFTDDVFVRRLKPVKKGAIRIGFYSLEKINWKKKIYIAAVGANYTDPNQLRSGILVHTSDKICLNDYKEEYLANQAKCIADLTKIIEYKMQSVITHIDDIHQVDFHENIMCLTGKGMNTKNSDQSIDLKDRYQYSKNLAIFFNAHKLLIEEELTDSKQKIQKFFNRLKNAGIEPKDFWSGRIESRIFLQKMKLFVLTPFTVLSLIHCYIPYKFVKNYVEKSFKRTVFHGSVKLLLGMILMGVINLPVIFLIHEFIYPSYTLGILYYLFIGLFFFAFIGWKDAWHENNRLTRRLDENEFVHFAKEREDLIKEIQSKIPMA
jgi:hypothetical protein